MTKSAKAEADRKAQELREQLAKQRAEEAKQRETERLNMLKAEHARQQKETPIILKTRGLKICKKEYLSKEYPYFVGYVEDSANQRVKVLVSEKILKPGQTDSNFKSNLIWDKAKNWYICE